MIRSNAIRCLGVLALVGMLGGCGGGGGGTPSTIAATGHGTATLALTAASAPEIAAQSVAVLTSLSSLSYSLAYDLESVSPTNPRWQSPCGIGGTWSESYLDLDRSGTPTPGDQIVIEAPGCSIPAFGNGRAIATVLAADDEGLLDVRIVVEGGTLPYLQGWNWVPTLKGTLRMTADGEDLWIRSEGALVFTPSPLKSFRASNLDLRLAPDETNNPPAPGIFGGLDLAFDTPAGAGRVITLDTDGLIAAFGANTAPWPGSIVLGGSGGSKLRISDARPSHQGWYLLATDANGDGIAETAATISFLDFFDAL